MSVLWLVGGSLSIWNRFAHNGNTVRNGPFELFGCLGDFVKLCQKICYGLSLSLSYENRVPSSGSLALDEVKLLLEEGDMSF